MQLRNRDVFETATYPANKVLMRINVSVEPSDRSRRAHFADEVFALEKLESAIYRRLRQTRQLPAQPAVDRFCRWMGKIFGKRPIHRQPLRRNSNSSRTAELLEFRAPAVHFTAVPSRHLIAVDYHLRIIII